MSDNYLALEIEQKWQGFWQTNSAYAVGESLNKSFYCLSMLPYPSGELHMGHVRNYTIGDTISRLKRMHGYNVLQPIGWDAFGLPAENAAINNKVAPAEWTQNNIANMRKQFKMLGLAYDWHREFATCKPEYYHWNQWLFLKMYEMGLVYQKESNVNWDPVDNTVLANEQVVDGRGWRSGAIVEKRKIKQWFFKITDYAEELLTELDKLDGWPEQVKTMQRNWIGKSVGHDIEFAVKDSSDSIKTFTTRADTLFGVTFIAVAPEHPILSIAPKDLTEEIKLCQSGSMSEAELATAEKIGFDTGIKAIHPATDELIPIYVTNYVLMNYGTGAVMGVPASDERDAEFAKNKNIACIEVISDNLIINSGEYNGLDPDSAKAIIGEKYGISKVSYRLRDWGISRQRYWGTPIPMIICEDCGTIPATTSDLPVILPENLTPESYTNTLTNCKEFVNTTCPNCNKPAKRETDTMDTFVDSSWYYARYTCPDQDHTMLDERAKYWTPVDQYIGGIEHATMHLLYARFIHKVLRDLKLVNSDEPFKNLLTQGMVLLDGSKMSKSKGNIVSPKNMIEKYGADTVRLFIMFAAPPEQALEWQEGGVDGAHRFLNKVWNFVQKNKMQLISNNKKSESSLRAELHKILAQARTDYAKLQLNTVVSACMKVLKVINEAATVDDWALAKESMKALLVTLHPICPHITLELWQILKFEENLVNFGEIEVDEASFNTEFSTYVVQINGKTRGKVSCESDADETKLYEACIQSQEIAKHLTNQPKKTIVVKNKLVNFVL